MRMSRLGSQFAGECVQFWQTAVDFVMPPLCAVCEDRLMRNSRSDSAKAFHTEAAHSLPNDAGVSSHPEKNTHPANDGGPSDTASIDRKDAVDNILLCRACVERLNATTRHRCVKCSARDGSVCRHVGRMRSMPERETLFSPGGVRRRV